MKLKEVKYIKNGEILASPIYQDENTVLIPSGSHLKEDYIDLLLSLNIEIIEIEDQYKEIQQPLLFIDEDIKSEFKTRIENILGKHIYSEKKELYKIQDISKDIISYVNTMDLNSIYDITYEKPDLYEHTIMVTILSLLVARKCNLSDEQMLNISNGCLLHDIGLRYITVPYVNTKIDELDPTDILEYKKHTILGYTVLDEEDWLSQTSKNMILSHHEKMNGTGFPLKQRNQEIECRIIQLCDSFDCLCSGIECKRYPAWRIIEYMESVADIKYDKDLVNILFSIIGKYPVGTEVELSNNSYGIITKQTDIAHMPVVTLLNDTSVIYNLNQDRDIEIKKVV